MLRLLARLATGRSSRRVEVVIEPLEIKKTMSDSDYEAVRKILREFASSGKYFAYCHDDDTLIWHQGIRGVWQHDDDGSQFVAFAREHAAARQAQLALRYFKKSCFGSHIDATLKAKRLASRQK